MKIGERIKKRRLELGYSVEKVATMLGKNRATIYRYESNEIENFPTTILEPLARVLQTTPANLMGWEEKHPENDSDVNETHKINKVGRIPVLNRVEPFFSFDTIDYETEEWEEIPEEMASKAEYFALRLQDNCMEPRICKGDVLIVRIQDNIESGDIGVVVINNENGIVRKVVKHENGIMLIAFNQSAYSPEFYDKKNIESLPVKILGKVVEFRAKF